MSKKIRVHLLVNEPAGNGNAKKANIALQQVLNELNIPLRVKSRFPRELTTLAKNYANTKPNKKTF